MMEPTPLRWRQRLEHFQQALSELTAACALECYSKLERAGLVQVFEFTFELAWKTLKDLLQYLGIDAKTPREVIRAAFEAGLLEEEDAESLLDALGRRNLLAHTYREALALEAEALIRKRYCPVLERLAQSLEARES